MCPQADTHGVYCFIPSTPTGVLDIVPVTAHFSTSYVKKHSGSQALAREPPGAVVRKGVLIARVGCLGRQTRLAGWWAGAAAPACLRWCRLCLPSNGPGAPRAPFG